MNRREAILLTALTVALHLLGMSRSPLPAQDGLKYLRTARALQTRPFADAVRGSDQHPLYAIGIASAEPALRQFLGRGPTTWHHAAQTVSLLASVALLAPIYVLTTTLFDRRTARWAVWLAPVLPGMVEVGHETLGDALALTLGLASLAGGTAALKGGPRAFTAALACGLLGGLGYWTRPEVALIPSALVLVGLIHRPSHVQSVAVLPIRRVAVAGVAFLAVVGSYAVVKGELSEKLALRRTAGITSIHDKPRPRPLGLPIGMREPDWDFSPKEEPKGHRWSLPRASSEAGFAALQNLGWLPAGLALWGLFRVRGDRSKCGVFAFVALFAAVLLRHATNFGYLSTRHALLPAIALLPWSAAGLRIIARRLRILLRFRSRECRFTRAAGLAALILAASAMQARPAHPTRWGYLAAGRWLAVNAQRGEAVYDSRGWALFLAGREQYDAWHIRQALGDSRLTYLIVGRDELDAPSRRGASLRTLTGRAGELVAAFPDRRDGRDEGVAIYRFHRPASWQGIRP